MFLSALITFSVAFFAIGSAAHSASFNCAKASTDREHLICADPDLSKLDGEVGQLYQQALAQLSPNGAMRLKQEERQWLIFIDEACPSSGSSISPERKNCITGLYRDRVEDLKLGAVRNGPYLFTRIDLYVATPAPPEVIEMEIIARRYLTSLTRRSISLLAPLLVSGTTPRNRSMTKPSAGHPKTLRSATNSDSQQRASLA